MSDSTPKTTSADGSAGAASAGAPQPPTTKAGRFGLRGLALLSVTALLAALLSWPVERRVGGPVVLETTRKAAMRLPAPTDGRVRELFLELGGTAVPGAPAAYFEPADVYLVFDATQPKPGVPQPILDKLAPLRTRVFDGVASLQSALAEMLAPDELATHGAAILRSAGGPGRGDKLPLDTPPAKLARETLQNHIQRFGRLIADINGQIGRLHGRRPEYAPIAGIAGAVLDTVLPAALDSAMQARERLEAEASRRLLRVPFPKTGSAEAGDWSVVGSDPDRLTGAVARAGDPLMEFGESARLVAVVKVPAGRVGAVREGQRVELTLTRFPGETRDAVVSAIVPKADDSGAFRVVAEVARARFLIDESVPPALARDGMPDEASAKLADLAGRRFDGPYALRAALAERMTPAEVRAFWPTISRHARAAAQRSLPEAPALQAEMEGAAEIIVGRHAFISRLWE